ncbi:MULTISPECIES: hypothetical protein [Luteimonas]|uniref:hypothetical protein n=1 Tax=Luteimonas TaxID=83614 RepID=UPI00117D8034|nr:MULTISPECIES: hypothetical protein [Luteimonas]
MKWSSFIARTAVRRVIWILVGLVVYAAIGWVSPAHAQACPAGVGPGITRSGTYPTRPEAYAACQADAAANEGKTFSGVIRRNLTCSDEGTSYRLRADNFSNTPPCNQTSSGFVGSTAQAFRWTADCPANAPWNPTTGQCTQQCTSKPDITTTKPPFAPAGMGSPSNFGQCSNSCYVQFVNNQDGTYTGVHVSNAQCDGDGLPDSATCALTGRVSGPWGCMDPPQECAAGQIKDPVTGECKGGGCPAGMVVTDNGSCSPEGDTCPPGQIKSPNGGCLPGEGQCAAGEARGKDGTCKRDSDGDGVPDSEGEGTDPDADTFAGGDSCSAPPSCNGNPILCGQARIQWRIDCNTRRRVNMTGGSCGNEPRCVGENCNAMEQSQLIQQFRATCHLEAIAQSLGEGGGAPGGDDTVDWLQSARQSDTDAANAVAAQGDGLEGVQESDAWAQSDPDQGSISETLFGGSVTQCPLVPAGLNLMGMQLMDPPASFWQLAHWIGWLLVASAYLALAIRLGD